MVTILRSHRLARHSAENHAAAGIAHHV